MTKKLIMSIIIVFIVTGLFLYAFASAEVSSKEGDAQYSIYMDYVNFLNDGHQLVTELIADDYINITSWAYNATLEPKEVTLIAVLYNDKGQVAKIEFDSQELEPQDEDSELFHIRFQLPENVDGYYIKVMFWDSFEGLKSLNTYGRPVTTFPMDEVSYYGYFIDFKETTDPSEDVKLKILTDNNEIKYLPCEQIIRFNGYSIRLDYLIYYLYDTYDYDQPQQQLIKYKLNSNGNIHCIYTAQTSSNYYDKSRLVIEEHGRMLYCPISQSFNNFFLVTKDTKVFFIPKYPVDESEFFLGNINFLKEQAYYDVEIYDFDDMNIPKVIVLKYENTLPPGSSRAEAPIAIVDSVINEINSEGEDVYKLIALYENEIIEKYAINDTILSSLQRGDVIQFNTDFHDRINVIQTVLSISDIEAAEVGTIFSNHNSLFLLYSDIVDWREDIIAVTSWNSYFSPKPFLIKNTHIYLYNTAQNIVSIASQEHIEPGNSNALIRCKNGTLTELIIIN